MSDNLKIAVVLIWSAAAIGWLNLFFVAAPNGPIIANVWWAAAVVGWIALSADK